MTSNQLANLCKNLLKEASKFSDYNFRSHAIRRVKFYYEDNLNESNPEKLKSLVEKAEKDYTVMKRQVAVGELYAAEKHILDKES